MGNGLSAWDPAEIAGNRMLVDREKFLREVKTGDMILFQGDGCASCLIRCMSVCHTWSHVGMVVARGGMKMITEANDDVIGRDVLRDDEHVGVQFVDLEKRLDEYDSHRIAYRRYTGRPVDENKVKDLLERYIALDDDSVPLYNKDLVDFLEYGTATDDDDNVRFGKKYYVCTSWFACLLIFFDIVPPDVRPGNYPLSSFGLTFEHGPFADPPMADYGELEYIMF